MADLAAAFAANKRRRTVASGLAGSEGMLGGTGNSLATEMTAAVAAGEEVSRKKAR